MSIDAGLDLQLRRMRPGWPQAFAESFQKCEFSFMLRTLKDEQNDILSHG